MSPGLPPRPRRAFSAMTTDRAAKLAKGFALAATASVSGIEFVGAWQARRFVIENLIAIYANGNEVTYDTEAGTLTLPIGADANTIVTECRRFGGRVERIQRDRNNHFVLVATIENETVHIVHAFHHVALCGSRGPWPSSFSMNNAGEECVRCRMVASTKPAHRARWHPSSLPEPNCV